MPFLSSQTRALLDPRSQAESFSTLLGVIFGVATVIVVVSLIEGFNAYVDEKIATSAPMLSRYKIFHQGFLQCRGAQHCASTQQGRDFDDAAALMRGAARFRMSACRRRAVAM